MPEISRFYGIVIKMFFKPKEHEPSHIHALYGEHIGIFDLQSMEMTEGDLPKKAQEMVKEWLKKTRKNYWICGAVKIYENCRHYKQSLIERNITNHDSKNKKY